MPDHFNLADTHGNIFALPRTPTVEEVQRCLEYIAAVEQLKPREKLAVRADQGDQWKMTRKQIWDRGAYSMKHDVEQWRHPYSGYISTEALTLAAVLCGAKIKSYRVGDQSLLDAVLVPPEVTA